MENSKTLELHGFAFGMEIFDSFYMKLPLSPCFRVYGQSEKP